MDKRIKILHIIQKMHSGGVEQRKLLLAQHLNPAEFHQKIICSEASDEFREKFESVGCEVFEVGYLKHPLDLKVHRKVLKIVKSFRPDIIHGSIFEGNILAAVNGFIGRVPLRIIEETSCPTNRKRRANALLKFLSSLSHHIIAISPEVGKYLKDQTKINPSKIKVINNGVRTPVSLSEEQKLSFRKDLGFEPNDIIIGSIGRMMNSIKGFHKLIVLFSELHQHNPSYKLLIIGDGPMLATYQKQVDELKLSKSVYFAGYQSEVNDYYEIMDFYITLPRSEGFGLSIVEAMSHGIPVFATNIGGIRNIIQDGLNGFFLEGEKSEVLKRILLELTHNKTRNKYIKDQAYITYKENFTSKKYASSIESLYQESLK